MKNEAAFAAAKVRLRKKRIGSIGASARNSHHANSPRNTRPPTNEPTI